jgi:hypothetical protein
MSTIKSDSDNTITPMNTVGQPPIDLSYLGDLTPPPLTRCTFPYSSSYGVTENNTPFIAMERADSVDLPTDSVVDDQQYSARRRSRSHSRRIREQTAGFTLGRGNSPDTRVRKTGIHGQVRKTGIHGQVRKTGIHGQVRKTGIHGQRSPPSLIVPINESFDLRKGCQSPDTTPNLISRFDQFTIGSAGTTTNTTLTAPPTSLPKSTYRSNPSFSRSLEHDR